MCWTRERSNLQGHELTEFPVKWDIMWHRNYRSGHGADIWTWRRRLVRQTDMRVVLVAFAVCAAAISGSRLTCSKVMQESRPEFHLVAPCSISGMTIIARTNTTSVKRCSQFANLKRGLAFNFISPAKKRTTPENCLIYDCPESDALQSIRREKDFDYYSLFADPLPPENAVCVVGVGMFRLHEERLNYTEAMRVCREEGGELASVLSYRRTNGLSDMIPDLKQGKEAYIGLNDIENEGRFVTMSGKLASCYEYRAWGLGEPRNRQQHEDCVTIDGNRNWKVVDCRKRLPFVCELLPKGPFPLSEEKGLDPCRINLSSRRFLHRSPINKEFYKKSLAFHWISSSFFI